MTRAEEGQFNVTDSADVAESNSADCDSKSLHSGE